MNYCLLWKNTHGGDNIESPADIYHHFVENKVPTSILKSPSVDFPHLEPEVEKSRHTVLPTASEVNKTCVSITYRLMDFMKIILVNVRADGKIVLDQISDRNHSLSWTLSSASDTTCTFSVFVYLNVFFCFKKYFLVFFNLWL